MYTNWSIYSLNFNFTFDVLKSLRLHRCNLLWVAVNMKTQYGALHPHVNASAEVVTPMLESGAALMTYCKERLDYAKAYLNVEKRKHKAQGLLV